LEESMMNDHRYAALDMAIRTAALGESGADIVKRADTYLEFMSGRRSSSVVRSKSAAAPRLSAAKPAPSVRRVRR
jgi:hypothetical protein